MAKTKAPTGLKLKRDHGKFTATWKRAVDYDKQEFKADVETKQIPYGSMPVFTYAFDGSVGKTKTEKSFTLKKTDYHPLDAATKNAIIQNLIVQVRGKKGSNSWSSWTKKTYAMLPPEPPKIIVENVSSYRNTFSIDLPMHFDVSSNDEQLVRWGTCVEYQTAFRLNKKDSSIDDIPDSEWRATATSSSSEVTRVSIQNAISGNNDIPVVLDINDSDKTSQISSASSAVRWVRARVVGPAGDSKWIGAYVSYAASKVATDTKVTAVENGRGGYTVTVDWNYVNTINNIVDYIKIQYAFASPSGSSMAPSSPSPQEAQIGGSDNAIEPTTSKTATEVTQHVVQSFDIDGLLSDDQLLYVRVVTYHNGVAKTGAWILATGSNGSIPGAGSSLAAPTNLSVSVYSGNIITVGVTNNCAVSDAKMAICWTKAEGKEEVIGVYSLTGTGALTKNVEIDPSYTGGYAISAYVFLGSYSGPVRYGTESSGYNVYSVSPTLKSAPATTDGNVPVPPTTITLEHLGEGNVKVTWNWSWKDADAAIIAYSDYPDALVSSDQPDTTTIADPNMNSWIIRGLEMGKTWYFWVCLVKNETASKWSERQEINLSSAPSIPVLTLSREYITLNDTFTASWTYVSTDTTPQASATIAYGAIENNKFVPTKIIATIPDPNDQKQDGTIQRVTLDPKSNVLNWETGQEYLLAVKVTSESGKSSDDWSPAVKITVVPELECSITETSLKKGLLTELPLTVKAIGAGDNSNTTIYIIRASSYVMARPDDGLAGGYVGEVVYSANHDGEDPFVIDQIDINGFLDDTADYAIVAEVKDNYGQVATDTVYFTVDWDHQALMPIASLDMDSQYGVAIITLGVPEGAAEDDVCDIYRMSIDNIQLVMSGCKLGEKYVDPYPTIGKYGGHRVVYRTKNGDYITEDNRLAWLDFTAEDGDILESGSSIIDFDTDRVYATFNADLTNTWKKDFQETKYLGGSIQGDWNRAVSRTGSIALFVPTNDVESMEALRRLATHAGECHIRTVEGSNIIGDVQVNESIPYQIYYDENECTKLGKYTLNITRVDPLDDEETGMTYQQYGQMVGWYSNLGESNKVGYGLVGTMIVEEEE